MDDCIFCKLANGRIPTDILYEDDSLVCIKDAYPQTDTHLLLIPKEHFATTLDFLQSPSYSVIAESVKNAILAISEKYGLDESGFRLINNCGVQAGQSVFHLHIHILSDEKKLRERLV